MCRLACIYVVVVRTSRNIHRINLYIRVSTSIACTNSATPHYSSRGFFFLFFFPPPCPSLTSCCPSSSDFSPLTASSLYHSSPTSLRCCRCLCPHPWGLPAWVHLRLIRLRWSRRLGECVNSCHGSDIGPVPQRLLDYSHHQTIQ